MSRQNNLPPLPSYEQAPPPPRVSTRHKVGAALAVAAAATTIAMVGPNHDAKPAASSAPYELTVDGDIDMSAVYANVKPSITPATTEYDRMGVEVVKVGEYIAVPGQKATQDKAEFINISPFADTEVGGKLDMVVAADAAILNSLAEQGKLHAIRFNMAVNPNEEELKDTPLGDMRFLAAGTAGATPSAAVIEYTLPAKGKVPMKIIADMTSHEATHIRQRNLNVIDKMRPEERAVAPKPEAVDVAAYRADIAKLRNATIDVAEQDPKVIAAAKKVVAVNVRPKTAIGKAQRKIAKEIIDGTFNASQPTQQKPLEAVDFTVDEARIETPASVMGAKLTLEQYDQATEAQVAARNDLDVAFIEALESPASPLSVFDESSYGNPNIYGHPHANASEVMGGAENVLQNHPQKLAAKLKQFPAAVRKTALQFMRRTNTDTQRANEKGHVSSDTQALHERLNNNMDWVEQEVNGKR